MQLGTLATIILDILVSTLYPTLVRRINEHYKDPATYHHGPLSAKLGRIAVTLVWIGGALSLTSTVLQIIIVRQVRRANRSKRHARLQGGGEGGIAYASQAHAAAVGFGGIIRRTTGDVLKRTTDFVGSRGNQGELNNQRTAYERVGGRKGFSDSQIELNPIEAVHEQRTLWDAGDDDARARTGRQQRRTAERYEPLRSRDA